MSASLETTPTNNFQHRGLDSRYELVRVAALELFASHGYGNVSIRDLATRLGISPGSIYNHVESKEQLLFELIESIYLDLQDLVVACSKAHQSAEVAIVKLMGAHLQLHEEKSLYFRLAEHEVHCLSPAHEREIATLRHGYEEHLAELLCQLISSENAVVRQTMPPVLVAILNNLPSWLEQSALPSAKRSTLLIDMALGALHGALNSLGPQFSSSMRAPGRGNSAAETVTPIAAASR